MTLLQECHLWHSHPPTLLAVSTEVTTDVPDLPGENRHTIIRGRPRISTCGCISTQAAVAVRRISGQHPEPQRSPAPRRVRH
jgi:hypothetical protein